MKGTHTPKGTGMLLRGGRLLWVFLCLPTRYSTSVPWCGLPSRGAKSGAEVEGKRAQAQPPRGPERPAAVKRTLLL